jgi:hypothetical protein
MWVGEPRLAITVSIAGGSPHFGDGRIDRLKNPEVVEDFSHVSINYRSAFPKQAVICERRLESARR